MDLFHVLAGFGVFSLVLIALIVFVENGILFPFLPGDSLVFAGAIIAAACPAATLGAMFSAKFQVAQKTAPAEILVSNLFAIGTMAFWIFVAEKLI